MKPQKNYEAKVLEIEYGKGDNKFQECYNKKKIEKESHNRVASQAYLNVLNVTLASKQHYYNKSAQCNRMCNIVNAIK